MPAPLRQLACFEHLDWSPNRRELVRFSVSMLLGFGILGLLFGWRAGDLPGTGGPFWIGGILLSAAGQVPGLGRWVYLGVHVPANAVGFLVSRVLLLALFYLLFTPIGLLLRLTGKDLLRLRSSAGRSRWTAHPDERPAESYYRQF